MELQVAPTRRQQTGAVADGKYVDTLGQDPVDDSVVTFKCFANVVAPILRYCTTGQGVLSYCIGLSGQPIDKPFCIERLIKGNSIVDLLKSQQRSRSPIRRHVSRPKRLRTVALSVTWSASLSRKPASMSCMTVISCTRSFQSAVSGNWSTRACA